MDAPENTAVEMKMGPSGRMTENHQPGHRRCIYNRLCLDAAPDFSKNNQARYIDRRRQRRQTPPAGAAAKSAVFGAVKSGTRRRSSGPCPPPCDAVFLRQATSSGPCWPAPATGRSPTMARTCSEFLREGCAPPPRHSVRGCSTGQQPVQATCSAELPIEVLRRSKPPGLEVRPSAPVGKLQVANRSNARPGFKSRRPR